MCKWEFTPIYRGFDSHYGYYNSAEDYFEHSSNITAKDSAGKPVLFSGVDFRDNKEAVTTRNGTYSTNLFTHRIQLAIMNHKRESGPFFIYAPFQAVHAPLEVPKHYITGECASLPQNKYRRQTFCGMMKALDEGISNITTTLDE